MPNNYLAALHSFEHSQHDPAYKMKSLMEQGECHIATGSIELASIRLEKALNLSKKDSSPETLHIRYWLAHCYVIMHAIEKAWDQWTKIYAVNSSYRDVAEKLNHYRETRIDDTMKDYLTCTRETFRQLVTEVVKNMELTPNNGFDMPNGFQLMGQDTNTSWLGTRQVQKLI